MRLFLDSDSLPKEVKALIVRRATKSCIEAFFISNKKSSIPREAFFIDNLEFFKTETQPDKTYIYGFVVSSATYPGIADDFIIEYAKKNDVLVSRDIPLASRAIKNEIIAINDRGELWTESTIKERLSIRNYMASLRNNGFAPALEKKRTYSPKDLSNFANALDKAIQKTAI